MRSCQSDGRDRRRRDRGVDEVEVLVRRTPRSDPGDADGRAGRDGARGHRQPQQPTRLLHLAATAAGQPARDGEHGDAAHHPAGPDQEVTTAQLRASSPGTSPSSGAVSRRRVTIQVMKPTIRASEAPIPGRGCAQHRDQADPREQEEDDVRHERMARHPGAAYPQMPRTTARCRQQQRLVERADEVDQEERHGSGRQVADPGGDGLHRAGRGAQRARRRLAQRDAGGAGDHARPGRGLRGTRCSARIRRSSSAVCPAVSPGSPRCRSLPGLASGLISGAHRPIVAHPCHFAHSPVGRPGPVWSGSGA